MANLESPGDATCPNPGRGTNKARKALKKRKYFSNADIFQFHDSIVFSLLSVIFAFSLNYFNIFTTIKGINKSK